MEYAYHVLSDLPDDRTGKNIVYMIVDAALGAFAVFFTQSPSFLDFQRTMALAKGISNAATLFGMRGIPCDNQIRNLLDGVPPNALFELFVGVLGELNRYGLQRQNVVGFMGRGVIDDDVGHDFWQLQRLGGPSPQS